MTEKCREERSSGQVVDALAGQKETSGGDSETEVNELHDKPCGLPAASTPAMMHAPVGR